MIEIWFRTGTAFFCLAVLLLLLFFQILFLQVDFAHAELFFWGVCVHLFFSSGIMLLASKRAAETLQPSARNKICALLVFGIITISGTLYTLTIMRMKALAGNVEEIIEERL